MKKEIETRGHEITDKEGPQHITDTDQNHLQNMNPEEMWFRAGHKLQDTKRESLVSRVWDRENHSEDILLVLVTLEMIEEFIFEAELSGIQFLLLHLRSERNQRDHAHVQKQDQHIAIKTTQAVLKTE